MMKTKIFGFVLMLGLAAFLGACEPETPPGEAPPAAPAPGEPTDGATPEPPPANP